MEKEIKQKKPKDITPKHFDLIPSKERIVSNDDFVERVGGFGGPLVSDVENNIETVNEITETAFDGSYNLITDVINARLNSATKKILSDFDFGVVDYAGALKSGDLVWNTGTGELESGSGVAIYRKGIIGANEGVITFSIDAETGDATFAGNLVAASGTLGTITAGTFVGTTYKTDNSGKRMEIGALDAGFSVYNTDGTNIAIIQPTDAGALFSATSPNTASRMFQFVSFVQNGSQANPMVYLEAADVSTGTTPLEIQQRGDKTSLKIQNYNTSAGIPLTIDNAGTANSIDISASGASGVGLNLALSSSSNNDDAIVISHAGTGRGIMMNLTELTSGSSGIEINNDGAGRGIYIHNDKTTGSGYGIYLVHAGMNSPLVIEANNATADNGTAVIQAYQASIYQLHYKKLIDFTTVRIWMSDGTAPNAAGNQLSGVVGDICLNCDGGKTYYCTGTTNWTAM